MNNIITYIHTHTKPIAIGLFGVVASSIFLIGLGVPRSAHADIIAPPCCSVPAPAPVAIAPVVPIAAPAPIVIVTPVVISPVVVLPIVGCMDSAATNYNPLATIDDGSCIYSPTVVRGCTSSTATNYNSLATIDNGSCVFPPGGGGAGGCTSNCGGGSGGGGGAGGGGGGTGGSTPNIVLSVLPHVGVHPLAYLYLSEIPYTGLDLGPVGTATYWLVIIVLSIVLTYATLFWILPFMNRSLREFGSRVVATVNASKPIIAPARTASAPVFDPEPAPEAPRGYSSYEGFKSFAHKEALSIDDIVKGLAREHVARIVAESPVPVMPLQSAMPKVEPIYEQVEPIDNIVLEKTLQGNAPSADIRGFATALIEGDRGAVFAGLRQQVRGGGAPEQMISSVACLLDDVYRARIDGSFCDPSLARAAAHLDTPALERLVAALTTAIDASYTNGITGAKLALIRALAVRGA